MVHRAPGYNTLPRWSLNTRTRWDCFTRRGRVWVCVCVCVLRLSTSRATRWGVGRRTVVTPMAGEEGGGCVVDNGNAMTILTTTVCYDTWTRWPGEVAYAKQPRTYPLRSFPTPARPLRRNPFARSYTLCGRVSTTIRIKCVVYVLYVYKNLF